MVILALEIPFTLWLQLLGALTVFLLGGFIGGLLLRSDKRKGRGFGVGVAGSTIACFIETIALMVMLTDPMGKPKPVIYLANHALWLNLSTPVNLMLIGIIIAGIGGILGVSVKQRTDENGKR
jgi:hypothetical protein